MALIAGLGAEVEWVGDERGPRPRGRRLVARARRRAVEPNSRLVPAGGTAARAARAGERPTAGRRCDRTPAPRPAHPRLRRAGRGDRYRRALRAAHGRPPRTAHLPRRGERDGDRERGHGGRAPRARRSSATPPASRTSRTSAASSSRSARRSRASSRTCCASTESTASAAASGGSAPSTSRSEASSASRRSPAATSPSTTSNRRTSARFCPRSDGSASTIEVDGTTLRVPPGQELVIRDDLGGQIPKVEDGPWPAFPADLTSIAVTVATQARGRC